MREFTPKQHMVIGTISITVVGILMIGLAYGVFQITRLTLAFFRDLDPQVATQIVVGSGTVLGAVLAVVIGQYMTQGREIREAHRIKKTEIYSGFLDATFDMFQGDTDASRVQYNRVFERFAFDLVLYGSPRVIRAFLQWKRKALATKSIPFASIDALYKEFRLDLALGNRKLRRNDLIRLFTKVTDWDSLR